LFFRLLRYGLPNGIQFFVDVLGFSVFILLLGRLGTIPLAASNIAFNVNTLAFMPMIGAGIAVSVVVGQALGRNRSDLAERGVYSGVHISLLYMGTIAVLYAFAPGIFLAAFAAQADAESFAEIRSIAVVALRFIAVFSLFDAFGIIFSSGLKGAGDTRFVMVVLTLGSVFGLVLPAYVGIVLLDADVFVGWGILTAYIVVLCVVFGIRFLGGKWKSMRVIEQTATETEPPIRSRPVTD
jgi:MATE family multidrug resistance protein